MSEIKIAGIGVSSGIKIGKAYSYFAQPNTSNFSDNKDVNIDEELRLLENAKKTAYTELEQLKSKVKETMGESKAEILGAQQAFLDDPAFYPEIIKKIENDKYTAQKAIQEVVAYFYNLFANLKDEYLRERATDIKDLGTRLINILNGSNRNQLSEINQEVILVSDDLTPSDTVQLNKDYIQAFVTRIGGKTSHTAILARTLEIPAIVGLGDNIGQINNDDILIIDGNTGLCIINPTPETIEYYKSQIELETKEAELLKEFIDQPAITNDGIRIEIAANIGNPNEAAAASQKGAEGIGLYRTEFLFMNNNHLPTEEEQYQAYKEVAQTMEEKPVIIRTLDIGGDKELSYLSLPKESNPFLGYRAIRLTLDRQDIFLTQLRAIIRASAHGNIKIMFPMVSNLQEWRLAKKLFEEAKYQLKEEGIAFSDNIELGIMIEIPSAALLAEQFAKEVDFFSIGTNDLVQYTLAVDRMNEKVAYLYDYFHPAILHLIKITIDAAHKEGKWTGMCGGMAGDTLAAPLLIGLGLDEWSMDVGSINKVKQVVSKLNSQSCKQLAEQILQLGTSEEVKEELKKIMP